MARTKGKDSLRPAKQHRGRRRRIVHVFTEGKVTEPTYIEIIRSRGTYADPTTAVEVRIENSSDAGSKRKPIKLVESAVPLTRQQAREAKRNRLEKKYWRPRSGACSTGTSTNPSSGHRVRHRPASVVRV